MTNHLENRIGRLLRSKAEQASGSPTLAAGARRKVRRIVVQRCLTASVAGVAALAVAVPVGLAALRHDSTPPILGPTKVSIDLDELPNGAPPELPYYSASETSIHDDGKTIPVDAKQSAAVQFTPVDNGYVVQVGGGSGARTTLIDSSGGEVRTLPTFTEPVPAGEVAPATLPAVSADRDRLAWPEWDDDRSGKGRLVVADAATGDIRFQKRFDETAFAYPVGFVGRRVVVAFDGSSGTRVWDPATGELSAVEQAGSPFGTDGSNRVLAATGSEDGEQTCSATFDFAVFDIDAGERLWDSCGERLWVRSLSKDGRHAFAQYEYGNDRYYAEVLDASTGRAVLEIRGDMAVDPIPEPDGGLLLKAFDSDSSEVAIIRCSIEGDCELATAMRSFSTRSVYQLPTWH